MWHGVSKCIFMSHPAANAKCWGRVHSNGHALTQCTQATCHFVARAMERFGCLGFGIWQSVWNAIRESAKEDNECWDLCSGCHRRMNGALPPPFANFIWQEDSRLVSGINFQELLMILQMAVPSNHPILTIFSSKPTIWLENPPQLGAWLSLQLWHWQLAQ